MSEIGMILRFRIGLVKNGLDRAFERLKADVSSDRVDKTFHVNASICELLYWVNVNKDWLDDLEKSIKDQHWDAIKESHRDGVDILKGLRFAHNTSKHHMEFIKAFGTQNYKELNSKLKVEDMQSNLVWLSVPLSEEYLNSLRKNLREQTMKQYDNYEKYVKGLEIVPSFEKAIFYLDAATNYLRCEYQKDHLQKT